MNRNTSEVLHVGLRLPEDQETCLEALRAALVAGEESGPATPFDVEAFVARKRRSNPARQRLISPPVGTK